MTSQDGYKVNGSMRPVSAGMVFNGLQSVADPDLQIRKGRVPGHPDPDIRGDPGSPKNYFLALRASVWSKNMEGPGPLGPSPGSAAGNNRT